MKPRRPNFIIDPGVFAPTKAADLFLASLTLDNAEKEGKALDLGTGIGVFAIHLARNGYKNVVAVDNNWESVECAKKNVLLHGLKSRVEVRLSNTLSGISPSEKFNLIITNPSNFPCGIWKNPNDRNELADLQLIGGARGNEVMVTVAQQIDQIMDKGRVVFLQPTWTNIKSIKDILREKGFKIKVLKRKKVELSYWPFEEWKYSKARLIEKIKSFEAKEKNGPYLRQKNGETAMEFEIVEASRK